MEEYRRRLDDGISLDRDKAIINLDHSRIQKNKVDGATTEMSLFLSLGESPFKEFIEHPLCRTFLYNKFKRVIWYFLIILMLPHFLFSGLFQSNEKYREMSIFLVVFSVYSGALFGYLCTPDKEEPDSRFDLLYEIECQGHDQKYTAFTAWIILILFLFIYIVRETVSLSIKQQKYFSKWETYRNLAIIASIFLVVYKGSPRTSDLKLQRWQYHLAGFTCLLLWLEMLILMGKIPKFGKYIHMFK